MTESPNTKEYQAIFNEFLRSTNDYHVRAIYYSTAISFFPLNIKSANGHYYVGPISNISLDFDIDEFMFLESIDINPEALQNLIHFQTGDEIIALNNTPIREVIEKIIDEDLGGDRTPTGYALAEKAMFFRKGKFGMSVPSGTFEITVQHQGKKSLNTYQFTWLHAPELIEDPLQKSTKVAKGFTPELNASIAKLISKDYSVGFAKDLLRNEKLLELKKAPLKRDLDGDDDDLEDEDDDYREKGFLPELGQVIWETDPKGESDVYAYLYLNSNKQKVGYIHIPTFMKMDEGEKAIEELVEILRRFEKESQALIVDITDNPGGSLLYTYAILSTLTNSPLKTLSERQVLIQEDIYSALIVNKLLSSIDEFSGTLSGYAINDDTLTQIIDYNEQIIQSWNAGKRMTDPLYALGIREILPHPGVQYTKPLIVLTNELDFSCADWFPAILQDNGRAVIFGAKTAGAGGSVRGYSQLSQFGVQAITITGSIGFRLDGKPIENLGITPDVPYQITQEDLKNNYTDYKKSLDKTVDGLINSRKGR